MRVFSYSKLLELAKDEDWRAMCDEMQMVLHTLPHQAVLKMMPFYHGVIGKMMAQLDVCIKVLERGVTLSDKKDTALRRVGVNTMNLGKLSKALAAAEARQDKLEKTLTDQEVWGKNLAKMLPRVLGLEKELEAQVETQFEPVEDQPGQTGLEALEQEPSIDEMEALGEVSDRELSQLAADDEPAVAEEPAAATEEESKNGVTNDGDTDNAETHAAEGEHSA